MTDTDKIPHVPTETQNLAETGGQREAAEKTSTAGGTSDSGGLLTRRRVVHGIAWLALLALVVPFVIYAVPWLVGANASFVVLSGSMEPSISAGDVVIVGASDPSTIAAGDVITFARGSSGIAVTHRVVDVDTSGSEPVFSTKGDANDNVDVDPVPAAAVIGTVVLVLPYIGYVIQFVGTTLGFVLLVVVPIGLLLVTEIVAYLRTSRGGSAGMGQTSVGDPHEGSGEGSTVDLASDHPSDVDTLPSDTDTGITLASNDVVLSLGVLSIVVPYVVYVAIELQTPLSIAVAVGLGTTLLLIGGVFLIARIGGGSQDSGAAAVASNSASAATRRDAADPAADGGTVPEESE